MKLKFLLLILITFQFVCSQNKQSNKLNEINRNGYSIFYNNSLRLDESGRNGTEFYLFSQKTNSDDNFAENVNLMIQNLETLNIDLNKFVEISENQIKTHGKLIESKRIKTIKNEFHVFVYEALMNGLELKFLQYNFVKNNKAYILTYTGKKADFDKFQAEMEKVMKSFKIN
jgi:hypothetical protein